MYMSYFLVGWGWGDMVWLKQFFANTMLLYIVYAKYYMVWHLWVVSEKFYVWSKLPTKVFTLWCEQLINMTFRKKWYKEKQTNWLLSNLSTPGIYTGPYFSSGKRTHDMEEYNFSQSSLEQVQYYQWCEKKDKLFDSLILCLY